MNGLSFFDGIGLIFGFAGFILSAASLIYLAKSLNAQVEVNKAQFKLLEIESRRAAREWKPILKLEVASVSDDGHTFTYQLTSGRNEAVGVAFEYLILPGLCSYSKNLQPGLSFGTIPIDGFIEFSVRQIYSFGAPITIRVHYCDEDGRPYQKDFRLYERLIKGDKSVQSTPYTSQNKRSNLSNYGLGSMMPITEKWEPDEARNAWPR